MKNYIFLLFTIIALGCTKPRITTEEVIQNLMITPKIIDANGADLINISVTINKDADATKRKIVFETSGGVFSVNELKTITIEAVYEAGTLIARTTIRVSSTPSTIIITAKPENRNPINDFILKDSAHSVTSIPFSIRLEANAFSVSTDYIGEVQLTGILKNDKNKNVSADTKVIFEDYYMNGTAVNGRFRALQTRSDDNSKISAIYSPGPVLPGTNFYVRCTVLNAAGNRTSIKDSVLLTVIP